MMESLVYLQLCELNEASSPTTSVPAKALSKSAVLLAATLFIGGWVGANPTYAQSLWDSGDEVQRLQFRLQVLGYENVQPTGFYDLNTQAAVMDFQQKNGLQVDGVVGRTTRPILFGNAAEDSFRNSAASNGDSLSAFSFPPEGANISSTLPQFPEPFRNETPAPSTDFQPERPLLTSRLFKAGSRGEDVRIIQRRLRELGYYYDSLDGVYGSNLTSAVTRFQSDRNLWPDGVVGERTLEALGLSELGGSNARGYVVVIPGDTNVLYTVQNRSGLSNARLQSSRRGNFVNAGQFSSRQEAESLAARLRGLGFDARVAHNP
ncbi:peptidoglycan-binding protein [Oscillatoria sp. FACHB-1406]|uniref:peptidoglycan-binding domain-containing protein n=1 Tax=Oscillatoria sp. FACHB-1406 TaxID=2692846 RepID=UPI001689137D|nr:peptidoglycan-binding protein [Oscillatoria sp. FACHB-1406]MBD2577236.1 peptidoglycan-binding protein [Oscillatoria sp. FACHB-1406]